MKRPYLDGVKTVFRWCKSRTFDFKVLPLEIEKLTFRNQKAMVKNRKAMVCDE